MKMVKRTLIAIAVVALVACAVQAAGPDPHFFPEGGTDDIAIKVNNEDITIGWPYEYKAITICTVPVFLNVGYYVEIDDCDGRKIEMQQVDCGDIGKGSGDWPCYYDCETIKIRSNFEVKLGTSLTKIGSVIDSWEAYYDGGDVVGPVTSFTSRTVCVKAWKAKLLNSEPGKKVRSVNLRSPSSPTFRTDS
jgi:hypothetical protein